ncbi:MAG: carboxypeptidase-like regulatory domain-containing protein, partial [Prevotellaceae bacterium]|nr:carboxypeptidase-like regulatory domain-containing protein [Prevotellaceae bacterium]
GSGQVKGTGTVKYDTGEPVPFGMVIFSTDTNQYTGEIKNGVFALGGIRPKNGLPPGNYKVTIQGTDENDKSIVAAKYNAVSTSDLSYEVKTGQKNYFEIIVQKP